MKKLLLPLLIAPLTFAAISCKHKEEQPEEQNIIVLSDASIHRDNDSGGAFIDVSINDFNNLGFKFGDSLNLDFSNGIKYEDVGYFSGYYVPVGKELVVGSPDNEYIKFCVNYGADLYIDNHFDSNTKVTISLDKTQKYKDIENTFSITYSDDRNDYDSDEEFANFRDVRAGKIKQGRLYRGASPVVNKRNRASIVNSLIEKAHIAYIFDLADTKETIDNIYQTGTASLYYKDLDDRFHKVLLLGMDAPYTSEEFSIKMKTMFDAFIANDGPFYVHCLDGKDHTGYVCMILEALCGATYEELVNDYFTTFKNYYKIEKGTAKYSTIKNIHIDEMIRYVFNFTNQTNLLNANYFDAANHYLKALGLSDAEIEIIINKLTV